MIKRDYHGFTLEQAMANAHDVVGFCRAQALRNSRPVDAEFITGHGIIRDELLKLLQSYGLTPNVQLGNTGVIVCVIE